MLVMILTIAVQIVQSDNVAFSISSIPAVCCLLFQTILINISNPCYFEPSLFSVGSLCRGFYCRFCIKQQIVKPKGQKPSVEVSSLMSWKLSLYHVLKLFWALEINSTEGCASLKQLIVRSSVWKCEGTLGVYFVAKVMWHKNYFLCVGVIITK